MNKATITITIQDKRELDSYLAAIRQAAHRARLQGAEVEVVVRYDKTSDRKARGE